MPNSPRPTGHTILVIEDSDMMQRLISEILTRNGYRVCSAKSGEEGLRQFFETRPDLILLDILLPGIDGYETCQRLLNLTHVPIIFVTAMVDDDAVVRGLALGAIDYIQKPFSAKVLLARVDVALRQRTRTALPSSAHLYDDGCLRIDLEARRVLVNGEPIRLTATEFELLTCLLERPGSVCTFEEILTRVWGWDAMDRTNVYTYIRRLRHKLEPDSSSPRYIHAEHGIGYRFEKQT